GRCPQCPELPRRWDLPDCYGTAGPGRGEPIATGIECEIDNILLLAAEKRSRRSIGRAAESDQPFLFRATWAPSRGGVILGRLSDPPPIGAECESGIADGRNRRDPDRLRALGRIPDLDRTVFATGGHTLGVRPERKARDPGSVPVQGEQFAIRRAVPEPDRLG